MLTLSEDFKGRARGAACANLAFQFHQSEWAIVQKRLENLPQIPLREESPALPTFFSDNQACRVPLMRSFFSTLGAQHQALAGLTCLVSLALFGCDSSPIFEGSDYSNAGGGKGAGASSGTGANNNGSGGGIEFGDGDGDGDGDGKGGSNGGTGPTCAESDAAAQLVPTNLLFVVDSSGSMECNEPSVQAVCDKPQREEEDSASKWEITQSALVGHDDEDTADTDETGAIRTLVGTQGLSAGLINFPIDDYCGVPKAGNLSVEFGKLNNSLVDEFDVALNIAPDGETPLAGAAIRGLEALRRQTVSGELEGNSYLVLMTDGVETCQPGALDDLKDFVQVAEEGFNIKTFVVGAPGSEDSRALLSEIAFLGGTAASEDCSYGAKNETKGDCHVDLTTSTDFAGDLVSVFRDITDSTQATCDFDIPQSALVDPNKVNVLFTPSKGKEEQVFLDERNCENKADGWQYTSAEKKKIVLCGDICDRVRADPEGRVDVVFGCQDSIVR